MSCCARDLVTVNAQSLKGGLPTRFGRQVKNQFWIRFGK
jgi:hypothetical protein